MKKFIYAALGGLAVIAAPQIAAAGCADFQIAGSEAALNYDPFGNAVLDRIFTVRVSRNSREATAVRFLLADPDPAGAVSRFGPNGPEGYDVSWNRDSGRDVFVLGAQQPNQTNGALVSLGGRDRHAPANETFRIRVPAGQNVAAGRYLERLEVRYVCYSGQEMLDSPDVQSGSQVALELRVPERISSFIGSPGNRSGQIDFGVIAPGGGAMVRDITVTTKATIPYDIEVDSERGGLKRSRNDAFTLPYALRLSGQPVRDRSRMSCGRTDAPNGRLHPLQVEINPADAAQAPAGSYSDTVTLTFSPRLGMAGGAGCSVTSG
jgi:hypothetical protein